MLQIKMTLETKNANEKMPFVFDISPVITSNIMYVMFYLNIEHVT